MPCLTAQLLPSRPKKPYNSSTSTQKHQRTTRHLHQDWNICSKLTNTSGAYTVGFETAALTQRKRNVVQCSLSTKAQIKGYYLTQIKVQTLDILWVFSSVQNFYHRKFIQPHEDFITNPATRWLHHTVGFFFFTTTTFKDLVYGQSSSHWQRLRVSSYREFFLFYHEPYQPQRINKVRVSFQTTPMGKNHLYSQSTDWGWFLKDIPTGLNLCL